MMRVRQTRYCQLLAECHIDGKRAGWITLDNGAPQAYLLLFSAMQVWQTSSGHLLAECHITGKRPAI
jgi:hypothetical protein